MYITNKERTLFYNPETNYFTMENPISSEIIIDDKVFSGLKTDLNKMNKISSKIDDYKDKQTKIYCKISSLSKEKIKLESKMSDAIMKKYAKKHKKTSIKNLDNLFFTFIDNYFPDKENDDEVRHPKESDFGGSIYQEYDGELFYFDDVFEKHYKPKYQNKINKIENQLAPLNKKLAKYNYELKVDLKLTINSKSTNSVIFVYPDNLKKSHDNFIDMSIFNKVKRILSDFGKEIERDI